MGGRHPILTWLDHTIPVDPSQRILVVAESAGGAAALRRAMTEVRGCLLGVDFVTPAGLARQVLAGAGRPFAEDVPDPLEERELLRQRLPEHGVGGYALRFSGALDHLLAAIHEVWTLGPGSTPRVELSRTAAEVVDLATDLGDELDARGGRARWIAAATQAVVTGATPLPDRVLVVDGPVPDRNVRLLLQVLRDRGVAVTHSHADGETQAHPESVQRYTCPDPFTELRLAARSCLDAGKRGVAWHDMVVAAPQLAAYSQHLRQAFDGEGAPFHTAVETPVLRHPRAALCLHVARLLLGDAPRASFVALANSPLLRQAVEPTEQHRFDVLSRTHALAGTGRDSRDVLSSLADEFGPDSAAAGLLRGILQAAGDVPADCSSRRRSAIVAKFLAEYTVPADPAGEDVESRIQDCLGAVVFADSRTGEEFVDALHELLRTRTVPLAGRTRGGVHIVTCAEALAFPCRHLHLIGLSRNQVPGPAPRTTFLGDDDRRALGLATTDATREAEEHTWARLLRHAPELVLSHPRTDWDGKPQEVTLWGERFAQTIEMPEEVREPGHPLSRARRAVESGRCPKDLAVDHLALGGCDELAVFDRLVASHSLRHAQQLESFDPEYLGRDGDIGADLGARTLQSVISVTDMNQLGRCPQQFLFGRVLRLRPLPEEPDPLSLPRDRMGTLIHRVIEELYTEFMADLAAAAKASELGPRMAQRAAGLLRRSLERDRSTLRREFPGLHRLLERRWLDGLILAIEEDLSLMDRDGGVPVAVEQEFLQQLVVRRPADPDGAGIALHIKGCIDRVDRFPDGSTRVLDFKTGKGAAHGVDAKRIFKGTNLQLVLYAMLLRAQSGRAPTELEIRAVRPAGTADSVPVQSRHQLEDAPAYLLGERAVGVQETLAVLGRLIQRGVFLPNPDRHCSYCDFRQACRRYHPPSAARVEHNAVPEVEEFTALRGKSTREPVLRERSR